MKKAGIFSVLLALLLTIGCGPIGPGVLIGPAISLGIMWVQGEATKYYEYDSEIMYRATKAALRELNVGINEDTPKDKGKYYISAGDADRFKIHIAPARENIARVSIRVNIMGDKPYAELIYKTIDEQVRSITFDQGRPSRFNRPFGKLRSSTDESRFLRP